MSYIVLHYLFFFCDNVQNEDEYVQNNPLFDLENGVVKVHN